MKEEDYDKGVRAELLNIHKVFPKNLAAEIDGFNSKVSPYESNVRMRTTHINNATEELEQIRKLFPEAKKFENPLKDTVSSNQPVSIWERLLSFFGLA